MPAPFAHREVFESPNAQPLSYFRCWTISFTPAPSDVRPGRDVVFKRGFYRNRKPPSIALHYAATTQQPFRARFAFPVELSSYFLPTPCEFQTPICPSNFRPTCHRLCCLTLTIRSGKTTSTLSRRSHLSLRI